jgi:hypothetical protein
MMYPLPATDLVGIGALGVAISAHLWRTA